VEGFGARHAKIYVHPDNSSDVDTVMARFVSAMRSYHNGHATKFTGDQGSAWRDWLAAAPVKN
jgi:hypothetical protein